MYMPVFGPEIDAKRAKAHVGTHLLAQHPERSISRDQINTLLDSPWPDHQLDAGWALLHEAMRARRPSDSEQLFQQAREAWEIGQSSTAHFQGSASQMHISLAGIDLWRRVKRGTFDFSERDARRTIGKLQLMHGDLLDLYLASEDKTEMDTVGTIAEAVCMDALNRLAVARRSGEITVPSESWNDNNYIRSSASYDLQQLGKNRGKKKVQVKLRSNSYVERHTYDNDVAVICLDQHWPGEWATVMSEHMMMAPLDDDLILGAADSMQRDIDLQLASAAHGA